MDKRVILKLSGEAFKGSSIYGIDPTTIKGIALEIKKLKQEDVEIAIVIGAGNLWRGKIGEELGMDRSQSDYMGMLGTIMNGLALQDALEGVGVPTRVMTALPSQAVAEPFIRRRALRHLEKGRIVIMAGGTGSPYFSTDTTAALRAAELNINTILMAKNGVDGVYDKDPNKHNDATLLKKVTHQMVLEKNLQIMDSTAASLCKDNHIKIIVFDMNKKDNIKKSITGKVGTIVSNGEW